MEATLEAEVTMQEGEKQWASVRDLAGTQPSPCLSPTRDGDISSMMLDQRMSHAPHARALGIKPKPYAGAEDPAKASAADAYMATLRLQSAREGNYRN